MYKCALFWVSLLFILSFSWVNFLIPQTPKSDLENILNSLSSQESFQNPNDSIKERSEEIKEKIKSDPQNISLHYNYLTVFFSLPPSWFVNSTIYKERGDEHLLYFYEVYHTSPDSFDVNIGRFGLGITHYYLNDFSKSINYLKTIQSNDFPYVNYALGNTYLKLKDTSNAIIHYKKECLQKNGYADPSVRALIHLYTIKNNQKELLALLKNPSTNKYFDYGSAKDLYLKSYDLKGYISVLLPYVFRNLNLIGFFAALLITIIWTIYIIRLNLFGASNFFLILATFILGMLFCFFTFLLSDISDMYFTEGFKGGHFNLLLHSIFEIGLIEEFVKIIPLLLLLALTKKIKEPYEYILFASISALGFAFIENLIYFDDRTGGGIVHGRALKSVLGHMIDSSIVAYGLVLSKFNYKKISPFILFPVFLLLGSISHGLYDYWLFEELRFVFIIYFLLSTTIWIVLINNCLNNSSGFSYQIEVKSESLKFYLIVSLTAILFFEYVVAAYKYDPAFANESLFYSTLNGSIFLVFFSTNLTKIDLVQNHWRSIQLKNFRLDSHDQFENILSFITAPFISNNINPQNFVGKKIKIRSSRLNKELMPFIPNEINGEIIDRITLLEKTAKNSYKSNTYWFLIRMNENIPFEEHVKDQVLIKFRDRSPKLVGTYEVTADIRVLRNKVEPLHNGYEENFPSMGPAVIRLNE